MSGSELVMWFRFERAIILRVVSMTESVFKDTFLWAPTRVCCVIGPSCGRSVPPRRLGCCVLCVRGLV